MKRILLFLSIVVLLLTLGVWDSVGDATKAASQGRGEGNGKLKQSLMDKAEEEGEVQVIVQLQSPEEPFAQLTGREVRTKLAKALRRGSISNLRHRVEAAMGKSSHRRFP
ncbi:MAG: hypothetical protein PVH02_10990, partial [Desulfobacteraceae bacterium]